MPTQRSRKLPSPKGIMMDAEERGLLACRAASDRKALDIAVLDLREISSITDLFLVCSGQNPRQMRAIAEEIDNRLSERGVEPLSREGTGEGSWLLLDYDDLVIHIFSEDARLFYDLERLWTQAPRLTRLAGEPIPESQAAGKPSPAAARAESVP